MNNYYKVQSELNLSTLISTGPMVTMVSSIKTSMNDVSQPKCKNWHLECMPWNQQQKRSDNTNDK